MPISPLLTLPIVRTRRLPAPAAALSWRESGDLPAAIVVLVVSAVAAILAVVVLAHITDSTQVNDQANGVGDGMSQGMTGAPAIVALALLLLSLVAILAAVAELTRVHVVSIDNDLVYRSQSKFGRNSEHSEPLSEYQGLLIVDRSRRLFIRNQDHPVTGRRGPVTEFVIVLRHAHNGALDVELFRAQPSLQTLFAMHGMQDSASGRASAANANACAALAASYRAALTRLCQQLAKPVLIADADQVLHEWPINTLDDWLHPPS